MWNWYSQFLKFVKFRYFEIWMLKNSTWNHSGFVSLWKKFACVIISFLLVPDLWRFVHFLLNDTCKFTLVTLQIFTYLSPPCLYEQKHLSLHVLSMCKWCSSKFLNLSCIGACISFWNYFSCFKEMFMNWWMAIIGASFLITTVQEGFINLYNYVKLSRDVSIFKWT